MYHQKQYNSQTVKTLRIASISVTCKVQPAIQ